MKNFEPDLSKNSNSLRRQVMISYLLQDIKDKAYLYYLDKKYVSDDVILSSKKNCCQ